MAKPFIVGYIETNEKSLECNFYKTMGVNAYAAAAVSAFTGQFYAAGGAALIGGAAELAYNLSGCPDNPPPPAPEPNTECWKTDAPGSAQYTSNTDNWTGVTSELVVEVLTQEVYTRPDGFQGSKGYLKQADGTEIYYVVKHQDPDDTRIRITGAPCSTDGDQPSPPLTHPPGEPIADPVVVTDPDTGCNWTIQATDAYIDTSGVWHTYYSVTADDPATCGGPFGYWSSPDGPDFVPVPPPPEPGPSPSPTPDPTPPPPPGYVPPPTPCPEPPPCPDPCPPCPEPTPAPTPTLGGASYQLVGVCESVPSGQAQPVYVYSTSGGDYYDELAARIDALAQMLAQHLKLKTPTCATSRAPLEGALRSVRWVSDGPSPYSNRPLRKLLRYRSKSGASTKDLGVHWGSFEFQAGSVVVIHKDAWWGTLQVWAVSEDEGKRVIRHAAAEAGIDPDTEGRWVVSSSRDSRYGVTGTMRVDEFDGIPWTTARPGPSGFPTL